jgi:hypothetical protein
MLIGPSFPLSSIRRPKPLAKTSRLSKRYDGCQANLGMNIEDIEKLYGKPLRVFTTKNGQTARIYGDTRYLEINSLLAFGGMAVVNDAQGRVTAIYSHQFFNDGWKK